MTFGRKVCRGIAYCGNDTLKTDRVLLGLKKSAHLKILSNVGIDEWSIHRVVTESDTKIMFVKRKYEMLHLAKGSADCEEVMAAMSSDGEDDGRHTTTDGDGFKLDRCEADDFGKTDKIMGIAMLLPSWLYAT